jgi:hypothetical protein
MKEVRPPRTKKNVVVVQIDPLAVARGVRRLPRGGAHQSARRPSRAQTKRELARRLAESTAGGRGQGDSHRAA